VFLVLQHLRWVLRYQVQPLRELFRRLGLG
jgi:hypothetical protein